MDQHAVATRVGGNATAENQIPEQAVGERAVMTEEASYPAPKQYRGRSR